MNTYGTFIVPNVPVFKTHQFIVNNFILIVKFLH